MAKRTTVRVGITDLPELDGAPLATPMPTPRLGAVLVVEDRDDVRQGLSQLLELHGFVVVDAADGEQAWAHLTMEPGGYALILLDLTMPGPISGRDLRAHQLMDSRLASIPTIVVSACEPDLHARALLRPDAWVEKPFRFDDLLAMVKHYVIAMPGALIQE